MPDDVLRLAVLIDAENASVSLLGEILAEVSKLGTATVKRVYGDFTSANLQSWGKILAEHAIQPIQQYRNTTKKNASDSALIIDAMDLLHTRRFEGFCLVSSDSDFTRLATRIKEDGLTVYGFGEKKTPNSFVKACNRFFYNEDFRNKIPGSTKKRTVEKKTPEADQPKSLEPTKTARVKLAPQRDFKIDKEFQDALEKAFNAATLGDSSGADLGAVANHLQELMPDFDFRKYGFKKLSDHMEQIETFSLSRAGTGDGPQRVYVERK